MDLKKLKKEELLKLKSYIDSELNYIDSLKTEMEQSKNKEKNTLLDLEKDDKIFCIIFKGSKIFNMDYAIINFIKRDVSEEWIGYTSSHDTLPMGCSSLIKSVDMNNHCFLSEFSGSLRFFSLKPETWKKDILSEMGKSISMKSIDIIKFKRDVKDLLKNKEIDTLLSNLKTI